ncbi:hypothetical protein DVK07_10770 [Halorubrum sp. Atlit-26R]|nr:hypothetical protein DVK07_10770 [Halorubrum sp. Atlit-26R]
MSANRTRTPSLAELQTWGRAEFEQYEPCLYHGSVSPKRVIRTIIRAANRELSWRGEQNANSLRDFWYNPTKPLLESAFPDKLADESFDFVRRMSQYLSETLSDMVQDGAVTYRELNILDESRERRLNLDSIEDDKILFVEKEAAYRKLRPLEEVYELSIVSGSGWQATALIEDLAYELDSGTDYTIYILTDYDPTGWSIGKDFYERSHRLGVGINEVKRIGISPEQLDEETVEKQKFSPPINSDRDREWLDERGIYGRYGLEIEAIGDLNRKGEALREMIVDELRDEIDVRGRQERDVSRALAGSAQTVSEQVFRTMTAEFKTALASEIRSILAEMDGVETISYDEQADKFSAWADLDAAESDDSTLPRPYHEDALHNGAISGDVPQPDSERTLDAVLSELDTRIENGEIELEALLSRIEDRVERTTFEAGTVLDS